MRVTLFILSLITLFSCKNESILKLKPGDYRALLEVQDNEQLPFIFKVENPHRLTIYNAEEEITVDEIEYRNDSVFIRFPFFRTYIRAAFEGSNLVGEYVEEDRDRYVDFEATYREKERFNVEEQSKFDVSGKWEMDFDDYGNQYKAMGVFEQEGDKVLGTIRTTKGDYRFLEGVMDSDTLKLSTFDTAHLFYFKARVTDSTLVDGIFYSGNHSREAFAGKINSSFELPDANELTFIKEGYEKFDFSFPDLYGNLVSLSDPQFKDKVVLVQIMGSYCPNCLDESKFFSSFYNDLGRDDFEILGLAFENAKTEEKAIKAIRRMMDRVGINYPILLAQIGTNSKKKAGDKLPMLNHVLSYPTTIFIDKKGQVRKIHTGFNGPATGDKYLRFKTEFTEFVDLLLKE
jgi:peroxiredoxin